MESSMRQNMSQLHETSRKLCPTPFFSKPSLTRMSLLPACCILLPSAREAPSLPRLDIAHCRAHGPRGTLPSLAAKHFYAHAFLRLQPTSDAYLRLSANSPTDEQMCLVPTHAIPLLWNVLRAIKRGFCRSSIVLSPPVPATDFTRLYRWKSDAVGSKSSLLSPSP